MTESAIFGESSQENDKHDGTSSDVTPATGQLGDCHEHVEDEEQAALGRLSSMSLMAAVAASGRSLAFELSRFTF
jgi:hypothetical protein